MPIEKEESLNDQHLDKTTTQPAFRVGRFLSASAARLKQNTAPLIFAGTDYLYLGSPHILQAASDPAQAEMMHTVVVAEAAGAVTTRLVDAAAYGLGYQSKFLDKLPMRIVGGTHVFILAPMYAVAGDYRSATFASAIGLGDLALTGDVQKVTGFFANKGEKHGLVRSFTDNPMVWFATGLTAAASYSVNEAALAAAVPLAVGAYRAVQNSSTLRSTGVLTNKGSPNSWFATTMALTAAFGAASMGPQFGQSLADAYTIVASNAHEAGGDFAQNAYRAVSCMSAFAVAAGYAVLEKTYNPDTFKRFKAKLSSLSPFARGEANTPEVAPL